MNQKQKDLQMNNFNNEKKKKKKEIYCQNCGKFNHVYKKCPEPITSFGIIAFKRFLISDNESISVENNNNLNHYNITSNKLIKSPSLYSTKSFIKNKNEKIKYL